jgi:hypothetical protein
MLESKMCTHRFSPNALRQLVSMDITELSMMDQRINLQLNPYHSSTYSNQNSAVYTDQIISPNIHTDRQATEFGADIRFFNNRLGFDITRYHYKNTGIIGQGLLLLPDILLPDKWYTYTNDG